MKKHKEQQRKQKNTLFFFWPSFCLVGRKVSLLEHIYGWGEYITAAKTGMPGGKESSSDTV